MRRIKLIKALEPFEHPPELSCEICEYGVESTYCSFWGEVPTRMAQSISCEEHLTLWLLRGHIILGAIGDEKFKAQVKALRRVIEISTFPGILINRREREELQEALQALEDAPKGLKDAADAFVSQGCGSRFNS